MKSIIKTILTYIGVALLGMLWGMISHYLGNSKDSAFQNVFDELKK